MPLEPGLSAEVEVVVTEELTADRLGNPGVFVYATPFVVTIMENASSKLLRPHLPPGAGTVGTLVEMKHLAATPIGMKVKVTATLKEIVDDGRRLIFAIEAFDEREKIGECHHERFIVTKSRFLEKVAQKAKE
jgi:predicted thioesterase